MFELVAVGFAAMRSVKATMRRKRFVCSACEVKSVLAVLLSANNLNLLSKKHGPMDIISEEHRRTKGFRNIQEYFVSFDAFEYAVICASFRPQIHMVSLISLLICIVDYKGGKRLAGNLVLERRFLLWTFLNDKGVSVAVNAVGAIVDIRMFAYTCYRRE